MRRGFSLVELSIVLVILGLLTGGILAGQSLIRAAELRSITTDFNRYTAATLAFRDKYFALPGDMTNATAFWGKDNARCTTHTGTTTTPGTCNGTGDGVIFFNSSGSVYEGLRAWQHLANAGLVEGSYLGYDTDGDDHADLGINIPRARISDAGFSFDMPSMIAYTGRTAPTNVIGFGSLNDGYGSAWEAIKPAEAWNIDTKMDDGKPGTGKLAAYADQGCATTTVASTAVYALTLTTNLCGFHLTLN
jgi:prepilin-type N-terminal cleavage/methylation domain-containing protein